MLELLPRKIWSSYFSCLDRLPRRMPNEEGPESSQVQAAVQSAIQRSAVTQHGAVGG